MRGPATRPSSDGASPTGEGREGGGRGEGPKKWKELAELQTPTPKLNNAQASCMHAWCRTKCSGQKKIANLQVFRPGGGRTQ